MFGRCKRCGLKCVESEEGLSDAWLHGHMYEGAWVFSVMSFSWDEWGIPGTRLQRLHMFVPSAAAAYFLGATAPALQ